MTAGLVRAFGAFAATLSFSLFGTGLVTAGTRWGLTWGAVLLFQVIEHQLRFAFYYASSIVSVCSAAAYRLQVREVFRVSLSLFDADFTQSRDPGANATFQPV